jgi:hypothetical protein
MTTIKAAREAAQVKEKFIPSPAPRGSEAVELELLIEDEEDERDGLALASQTRWTEAVDGYSNPNSPEDDSEELQQLERKAGLEGDEEEWNDELTGVRADNAYLPGQRMAEQGLDHEVWPKE